MEEVPPSRFCLHNELEVIGKNLGGTAELWLGSRSWFSNRGNLGDEKDPQAIYSALDGLLKGSLERLKSMRLGILNLKKLIFISFFKSYIY